jgi:hypothetical protein
MDIKDIKEHLDKRMNEVRDEIAGLCQRLPTEEDLIVDKIIDAINSAPRTRTNPLAQPHVIYEAVIRRYHETLNKDKKDYYTVPYTNISKGCLCSSCEKILKVGEYATESNSK